MKKNKTELDVDFIGGHGALTAKEEKELSLFFKQRKSEDKQHGNVKRIEKTTT